MKRFDERLKIAHKVLLDMINKIPDGEVKVEFYTRTEEGIDASLPITERPDGELPDGLYTNFKIDNFKIDLKNPSEAIVSILLWMMVEPNIVSVIKWNDNIFLPLDIYNLLEEDHFRSGPNPITESFIWDGTYPDFTPAIFNNFKAIFDAQFEYGDIMHFLAFHNHEVDGRFSNIIDYIKDKMLQYFIRLEILDGDTNPKIFELT